MDAVFVEFGEAVRRMSKALARSAVLASHACACVRGVLWQSEAITLRPNVWHLTFVVARSTAIDNSVSATLERHTLLDGVDVLFVSICCWNALD